MVTVISNEPLVLNRYAIPASTPLVSSWYAPMSTRPFPTGATSRCAIPQPDRVPPTLIVDRIPGRLVYDAFLDGFTLRVRTSEPSALKIDVSIRVRRRSSSRARYVVVAKKDIAAADGSRLVRLKPRHKLLGKRHRFVTRVRVHATDLAGNRTTATKLVRVTSD